MRKLIISGLFLGAIASAVMAFREPVPHPKDLKST